ncbi:hypothetical protein ACGF5M_01855 [Gemmatimonadota bacterium]
MKNLHVLVVITIVSCTVVFILTLGDFLALHDIQRDYVSQGVFGYLETPLPENLPAWTGTPGEWSLVTVSWVTRVGYLILSMITLVLCANALRERSEERT